MRRLARRLGTAPMSLYRHVAGKEELLGYVAEALAARLPVGDPAGPWDEALSAIFTGLRRVLGDHPGIAAYLSDEAVITPTTLQLVDRALDALRRGGLDEEAAAGAFTTLWTFTIGSVLVEQSLVHTRPDAGTIDERRRRIAEAAGDVGRGRHLRVAAAVPHWLAADADDSFDTGLRLLLDGIRARAARA
jgi:AcrR family transcriptional regulator